MVSDPVALRHILGDTAIFARSDQQQRIVRELIGEKTMLYVHGKLDDALNEYRPYYFFYRS